MQKSDARHSSAAGESKLHFLDYWRVVRVRFGIVLLTFLLVVITTGVVTYFLPKKYRAETKLELRDPRTDPKLFEAGSLNAMGGGNPDVTYIQSQFDILQSQEVLYPVIEKSDLQHLWAVDNQPVSREYAYYKLRGMLTLKQVHGSFLMDLAVTSTDADEAARLVNAVAESYKDVKIRRALDINDLTQDTVRSSVVQAQQKEADLLEKVQKMRRDKGIIDLDPDNRSQVKDPFEDLINGKKSEVDKNTTNIDALTSQLIRFKFETRRIAAGDSHSPYR